MITYPFPPNASAGATRSERFARYLPKYGWKVDVVTIKPRHDLYKDRSRLKTLDKNVMVHQTVNLDPWLFLRDKRPRNIILKGVRSILMKIFSFPDHMLLWVPFAVKAGLRICNHRAVDTIYTTSPPHSTHLAGMVLSGLTKKPWIADFRDPWTLNAHREKGSLDGILLQIERTLEKTILEKASVILANTDANRRNLLRAFHRLSADKVVHLPNGWEEFPERCCDEKKNGLFTIVHAGTFYPRFKPYALLKALAAWRDGKQPADIPPMKDIQVILLGSNEAETKHVVQNLGLEEIVHFRPWVALDEARSFMLQADILWVSLGTGDESSTFIPSKLFEYIAARRPILGFFPEGEASALIKKTGTGITFPTNDHNLIIKSIYQAMSSKEGSFPPWFRPDEQVIATFHIEKIASRFYNILHNVNKLHTL